MPGIHQISTSFNNMDDMENYIEARITDKMLDRKLTDNTQLLEEISLVLLLRSSGMYNTNISVLKISLMLYRS
jgi:hypothetical protein